MSPDLNKLREELAALEKELESSHFGGLFDTRGRDHKLRKLKKLRKEIAALEGNAPSGHAASKPAAGTVAKTFSKSAAKTATKPAAGKTTAKNKSGR
jgi:inorganic triphosphatase YgiF